MTLLHLFPFTQYNYILFLQLLPKTRVFIYQPRHISDTTLQPHFPFSPSISSSFISSPPSSPLTNQSSFCPPILMCSLSCFNTSFLLSHFHHLSLIFILPYPTFTLFFFLSFSLAIFFNFHLIFFFFLCPILHYPFFPLLQISLPFYHLPSLLLILQPHPYHFCPSLFIFLFYISPYSPCLFYFHPLTPITLINFCAAFFLFPSFTFISFITAFLLFSFLSFISIFLLSF